MVEEESFSDQNRDLRDDDPPSAGGGKTRDVKNAVILLLLGLGFCWHVYYNGLRGSPTRTHSAWFIHNGRDIYLAAHEKNLRLSDEPYWGPVTGEMMNGLGLDPAKAIDSRNNEGPGEYREGPRYSTDRGAYLRMKGYPIWVFSDGDECEILVGRGIDRDVDLTRDDLTGLTKWLSDGGEQPTAYREKLYDPTNGDIGSGDLISIVRPRG